MSSLIMTEVNVTSSTNHHLNQICTDMIHVIIPRKYDKYTSILIPKYVNILAEEN